MKNAIILFLCFTASNFVFGQGNGNVNGNGNSNGNGNNKKITICHHPPGNPTNTQQIDIPPSAWAAHQAHGDTQGPCPTSGGTPAVTGGVGVVNVNSSTNTSGTMATSTDSTTTATYNSGTVTIGNTDTTSTSGTGTVNQTGTTGTSGTTTGTSGGTTTGTMGTGTITLPIPGSGSGTGNRNGTEEADPKTQGTKETPRTKKGGRGGK